MVLRKAPRTIIGTLNKIVYFFCFSWRWIKDFWVKKPYKYPVSINRPPTLLQAENEKAIIIGIASDWANDTPQSVFIGACLGKKGLDNNPPDVTIHLGDTYFSGSVRELNACFGKNGQGGHWPRGVMGTFALAGNHEMYSSGVHFYNMISRPKNKFGFRSEGQEPVFCLETDHWRVIGLDTGYNSLRPGIHLNPDNLCLLLKESVIKWLGDVVKISEDKRGIIILTHHQIFTGFNKEMEFINPAEQLQRLLPGREVIWIWGHEHRFAMYGKYAKSPDHLVAYGRCIGNGGMPNELTSGRNVDESRAKDRNLVIYDKRMADSFPIKGINKTLNIGYNGYAVLQFLKSELIIQYYAGYKADESIVHTPHPSIGSGKDELVFTEKWRADTATGKIVCTHAEDHTAPLDEGLTQYKTPISRDVFN